MALLCDGQARFDCRMQFIALLDYIRYSCLDEMMVKTVKNKLVF
jgi:hypothetical protein